MQKSLFFKTILCIAVLRATSEECTSSTFTFARPEDHFVAMDLLPGTNYSTICQYIATDSNGYTLGVVRSYSVGNKFNMAFGIKSDEGAVMEIHVDGQIIIKAPQKNPHNAEIFPCLVIDAIENTSDMYVNGKKVFSTKHDNLVNAAWGELWIGGSNTTLPGYVGKIRNLVTWNRKLSDKEIEDLYNSGTCPEGVMKITLQNVLPHGFITPQEVCAETEHVLSNVGGKLEYVEVVKEMPAMESATICAWVTTNSNGMVPGTVGSIAIGDNLDVITSMGVMVNGVGSLRIFIEGQSKAIALPLEGDTEYHFCLAINLFFSKISAYLNGEFMAEILFQNLQPIPAGVKIIVGQRQGCLGGCFDSEAALNGKIRNFNVWDRVLSAEEIGAIVSSNQCPIGRVADLTAENILAHKTINRSASP